MFNYRILSSSVIAFSLAGGSVQPTTSEWVEPETKWHGATWFVKGQVNDQPARWFIFDTGSPTTFLTLECAKAAGLSVPNELAQGDEPSVPIPAFELTVGGKRISVAAPRTYPMRPLYNASGEALSPSGLLGADLLNSFVVRIDPILRTLSICAADSFDYRGSGEIIPIDVETSNPKCQIMVNNGSKAFQATALIDTGFYGATAVSSSFARRISLSDGQDGAPWPSLSRVQLGGNRLNDVPVTAVPYVRPVMDDVIIGASITNRFVTIFDYKRRRLILEKTARTERPFAPDLGCTITLVSPFVFGQDGKSDVKPAEWRISDVGQGSRASLAGLRDGDRLLYIARVPIARMAIWRLVDMLAATDLEPLPLTVLRDEREIDLLLPPR